MLESGNLGGKCVDLNTLFVGLARAAGVPAATTMESASMNPRAIKHFDNPAILQLHSTAGRSLSRWLGWVPVDPADVRQLALDEALPIAIPGLAHCAISYLVPGK